MSVKWLDRDTVRAPYMTLCLSEEAYLAVARHCNTEYPGRWLPDGSVAAAHSWMRNGRLTCVVCLDAPKDYDSIDIASTLVHEAVHVYQRLCDSIGETAPGREFEAYTIERISERLMREYVRQTT